MFLLLLEARVCQQQHKINDCFLVVRIWVFPRIGVPQNGWFIMIMENPIKMNDLGVPIFLETPIYTDIPLILIFTRYISCFGFGTLKKDLAHLYLIFLGHGEKKCFQALEDLKINRLENFEKNTDP